MIASIHYKSKCLYIIMTYHQHALCGSDSCGSDSCGVDQEITGYFDQEINEYSYSLLRFSNNKVNGLNPLFKLQYFFPEGDKAINLKHQQLYPESLYRYSYGPTSPTSPLYIVNVKIWSANKAKLLDLPVSEFFDYNGGEIVRTKASDDHTIDNEFYKFILKKITETYEYVDGVYMPAHGTAHEEVVLQQSGVVKLEVIERRDLKETVKGKRDRERRERRERTKGELERRQGKIGKKINFDD